jgi:hypothetical protein
MSLAYKQGEQPNDPDWVAPVIKEWTPEMLKELERAFGCRGCWPYCLEHRKWVEDKFDELFKTPNYKSQYFGQSEFDEIRRKRGII